VKKLTIFVALVAVSTIVTLLAAKRDDAPAAPVAQDVPVPAKKVVLNNGCNLAGVIPDCDAVMARLSSGGKYDDHNTDKPSVLLFDPAPVTKHEVPNDDGSEALNRARAAENADRIISANLDGAVQRAEYGVRIANRGLDNAIKDYGKTIDDNISRRHQNGY
jgi:hypothetical protein